MTPMVLFRALVGVVLFFAASFSAPGSLFVPGSIFKTARLE